MALEFVSDGQCSLVIFFDPNYISRHLTLKPRSQVNVFSCDWNKKQRNEVELFFYYTSLGLRKQT